MLKATVLFLLTHLAYRAPFFFH